MAQEHSIVKPEKMADAAVTALRDDVVIANTVTRRTFDEFKGVANDTITQRVEGSLPVREYGWRNDRREPIKTDEYREQTVEIKVEPSHLYSATELTDEQKEFDFKGDFGRLFNAQMRTIKDKLERNVLNEIVTAPYEYRLSIDNSVEAIKAAANINRDVYHTAFVKATRAIKKMRAPGTQFTALVGSNVAEELMVNQKLVADQGRGPAALAEATLGRIAGVNVVESSHIGADDIFIYEGSAFIFFNAAPPVPKSAAFASTANEGGFSMRWIQDYDPAFANDRSLFSTWAGYGLTRDNIEVYNGVDQSIVSPDQFFTRGVHLTLGKDADFDRTPGDGNTETPGGEAKSFLALAYNNKFTEATTGAGKPFPGVMQAAGWPGVPAAAAADAGDTVPAE